MMARRPFATCDAARSVAREEWFALTPTDWREAFEHHPRIGEAPTVVGRDFLTTEASAKVVSPGSAVISAREQARVADAHEVVKQALTEGNREYERRFGHIYIVCATGKSADEMLAILQARLKNDPETEIRVAAEEHAKICDLRLTAQDAT